MKKMLCATAFTVAAGFSQMASASAVGGQFRGGSAGTFSGVAFTVSAPNDLPGQAGAAVVGGTTLQVPNTDFCSGIIQISGPVSALTITPTGAGRAFQAYTLGQLVPEAATFERPVIHQMLRVLRHPRQRPPRAPSAFGPGARERPRTRPQPARRRQAAKDKPAMATSARLPGSGTTCTLRKVQVPGFSGANAP